MDIIVRMDVFIGILTKKMEQDASIAAIIKYIIIQERDRDVFRLKDINNLIKIKVRLLSRR